MPDRPPPERRGSNASYDAGRVLGTIFGKLLLGFGMGVGFAIGMKLIG